MNERRQRVDNQPYGRAGERLYELLFPADHPYSWPVIGTMEDIAAATLDEVREFFATYTARQRRADARRRLRARGGAGAGRAVVRRDSARRGAPGAARAAVASARRALRGRHRSREARAALPGLRRARLRHARVVRRRSPGPDLAGGKASRLYRDLVHERELAQSITCYALPTEAAGSFHVVATARPGTSLDELGRAVDEHLAAAAAAPAAAEEIERVRNRMLTGYFSELQTLDRRADLLSQFTTYFDRPQDIAAEIAIYQELDAAEIRRWLRVSAGTIAFGVGRAGDRGRATSGDGSPGPNRGWASGVNDFDRSRAPAPGPAAALRFPAFSHRRLASGLDAYVVEERRTPLVSMRLLFPSPAPATRRSGPASPRSPPACSRTAPPAAPRSRSPRRSSRSAAVSGAAPAGAPPRCRRASSRATSTPGSR